jgi:hypothetical protein
VLEDGAPAAESLKQPKDKLAKSNPIAEALALEAENSPPR